jgi:hypothetical protein
VYFSLIKVKMNELQQEHIVVMSPLHLPVDECIEFLMSSGSVTMMPYTVFEWEPEFHFEELLISGWRPLKQLLTCTVFI